MREFPNSEGVDGTTDFRVFSKSMSVCGIYDIKKVNTRGIKCPSWKRIFMEGTEGEEGLNVSKLEKRKLEINEINA